MSKLEIDISKNVIKFIPPEEVENKYEILVKVGFLW
jgi:hypothetical protein